jgi:hypothetical protein
MSYSDEVTMRRTIYQGTRRHWRLGGLIAIVVAAVAAASALALFGSRAAVARHETVLLVPPLQAGGAGWCLVKQSAAEENGGCSGVRARYPFLAQVLHTSSTPPEAAGILLTAPQVAAVSIGGGAPLATHAEPALPDGLRVVVWRIAGEQESNGGFPPSTTALAADGAAIPQAPGRGQPLITFLSTENTNGPANPQHGACSIAATTLPTLSAKRSEVVPKPTAYHSSIAGALIACATTEYSLNDRTLLASVLSDAADPGATPSTLPAMKPVAGHLGTFEAPGQEGPQVARRIPGGWLVVSKGGGEPQRLSLLGHLRATVRRLGAS